MRGMNREVRVTKHITGLMLAGLIVAMGCNRDDQMARQKGALESRRAEVTAETDKVVGAWIDTMAKTLPADVKKYPKVKSALVPWRLAALDYDWRRPLGNVLAKVRSTPFEAEYKGLAEFFEVMEKFWKKEVDFKDYMEAFDRLMPRPNQPTSSCWRGVSETPDVGGGVVPSPTTDATSACLTRAESGIPPSAASRSPATTSAGGVSLSR